MLVKTELTYQDENYDEITKVLEISFINQRMVNEHAKINMLIMEIRRLYKVLASEKRDRAERGLALADGVINKEKYDQFNRNIERDRKRFDEICSDTTFSNKLDLVIMIMKRNKCHPRFLELDFWNTDVSPEELDEFLACCIYRRTRQQGIDYAKEQRELTEKKDKKKVEI